MDYLACSLYYSDWKGCWRVKLNVSVIRDRKKRRMYAVASSK
jgi:hypothetical protein